MSEWRDFFDCSCASSSCWGVGWIVLFGLFFRLIDFLNLRCCRIFLVAVSLLWISVLMALSCSWFVFDLKEVYVLLISLVVSATFLSQNWTMCFTNDKKNGLEHQLSKKIWSWLSIVGSSINFTPFGTRPSLMTFMRFKTCLLNLSNDSA